MHPLLLGAALLTLCSCGGQRSREHTNIIGMNSFALAARYGTPASYQLQGDYMQLDYGIDADGCRLIVLVDQDQRVVGWASSGLACPAR